MKSEAQRQRAAKNLRVYVEAEAREMSAGTFSKFLADLHKRINDIVSSAETNGSRQKHRLDRFIDA